MGVTQQSVADAARELIYEAKTQQSPTPDHSTGLLNRLVCSQRYVAGLLANCHLIRADLIGYLGLANEKYLALFAP